MACFSGFAAGTFTAGIVSDYVGRRAAIGFFSQLLFGAGILATIMPDIASFTVVWFFVGKLSVDYTCFLDVQYGCAFHCRMRFRCHFLSFPH
jgi:MFS family permease